MKKSMKKKFYGALVLGSVLLAGGMVSCSDYDDDIDRLNNRVTAVEQTVKELQDKINAGAVITDVQTVENGVKVTLSDGSSFTLVNGKDGSAGSVVTMGSDGYWYIDGQKTENPWKGEKGDKGDQGDPGTSGTTAPSKYYVPNEDGYWYVVNVAADGTESAPEKTDSKWAPEGMMTAAWDTQNEVLLVSGVKDHEGVLRIDLGTNLKGLVFTPSLYLDGVEGTRYPYISGKYKEATGEASGEASTGATFTIPGKNTYVDKAAAAYIIGANDTVVYHMNPTSAQVKDADFRFLYNNPEWIEKTQTRANGVTVNYNNYNEKTAEGDLKVGYQITNPELLEKQDAKKISVMALEVELGNDTTITSDYAAIVPAVRTLKAIAFKEKTTEMSDGYDLYDTGKSAVEKEASVAVQYNGGSINLSNSLNIHYIQNDWVKASDDTKHEVMSYERAKQFGLHFEYEMLPYTTGTNNTEEDKYGYVDKLTGVFTPYYVNENGESVACPDDKTSTTGISAVGREPVVIVKLVNEKSEVVLAGYIKIDIVKEISTKEITVKDFTKPYVCDGFVCGITWDDMSGKIIEELQMTKDDFVKTYELKDDQTYIKEGNEFVAVPDNKFGVITVNEDLNVSTTNDIVVWTANIGQMDAVYNETGHTVTLYACFQSRVDKDHNLVYIGLTTTVLDKPEVTFGEKIKKYWYPGDQAEVAKRDTVRMNVARPTSEGITKKEVLLYAKDLDDNFKGNKVVITPTAASQNEYYDLAKLGTKYHYEFAKEQPKIGEYQLACDEIDPTKLVVSGTTTVIAQISDDGTLKYENNLTAQAILNIYGHNNPLCYANVEIAATYDDCDLALGKDAFKVRFLRPVDILPGDNAKFVDAQANGSSVTLGDLFKLQDWRDKLLITKNNGTYASAEENGCKLYDYYLFETIKINIANAECNLTGKWEAVQDVTNKLQLYVEGSEPNTSATLDIKDVAALNTAKITYKNNEGNVQKFNLRIPVEIKYSWGTLKGVIEATVDSTIAND